MKVFSIPNEDLMQLSAKPKGRVTYKEPLELGCFSYDAQRNLTLDRSQLRRFVYTPELLGPLGDLNHGMGTFVEKDVRSHLFPILRVLEQQPARPKAQIVTWRGCLTRIFSTAFDHQNDWAMYGTVRNGVLYIEEERKGQDGSQRARQCTYWGHKFEGLCMVDHRAPAEVPPLAQRRETPVNTNEEFGIVVKVQMGSHHMILGAEVDGIDEQGQYVELKTSKLPVTKFDERFFKEKLMKFWLQSFLVAVPRVIVGLRDKSGHLREFQHIKTNQIPKMVLGHVTWDWNALLLYGDIFFHWLNDQIQEDVQRHGPEFSFTLRHARDGKGEIRYAQSSSVSAELPDWYKYY